MVLSLIGKLSSGPQAENRRHWNARRSRAASGTRPATVPDSTWGIVSPLAMGAPARHQGSRRTAITFEVRFCLLLSLLGASLLTRVRADDCTMLCDLHCSSVESCSVDWSAGTCACKLSIAIFAGIIASAVGGLIVCFGAYCYFRGNQRIAIGDVTAMNPPTVIPLPLGMTSIEGDAVPDFITSA